MDEELPSQPIEQSTKQVDIKVSGFKLYIFLVMILFIGGVIGIVWVVKNNQAGANGIANGSQVSGDTSLTKFIPVSAPNTPVPVSNQSAGPTLPAKTASPTPKPSSKVLGATASPTPAPTATPTPTPAPTAAPTAAPTEAPATSTPSPNPTATSTPTSNPSTSPAPSSSGTP